MTGLQAAKKMRAMDDDTRDQAITDAGDKVVDMLGYFAERQKQRALAEAYRRPKKPDGPA